MAKSKTRKKKCKRTHRPVTDSSSVPSGSKKRKKSAQIIAELHQVNQEKERLKNDTNLSQAEKRKRSEELTKKEEELGGIKVYQFLSKNAECRHGNFNSAQWVLERIQAHEIKAAQDQPLNLLDVGALDFNYKGRDKVVECTYIDLNPQKQGILKADFLTFKSEEREVYDIIVLSLVINFAGDISDRGDMLRTAHRLCKTGGHVAVVLPLACLLNSRYMTHERLEEIMSSIGFDLISSKESRKLSFKFFKKVKMIPDKRKFPKEKIRNGVSLNNFSIVLN